jgi:hypothetical protein
MRYSAEVLVEAPSDSQCRNCGVVLGPSFPKIIKVGFLHGQSRSRIRSRIGSGRNFQVQFPALSTSGCAISRRTGTDGAPSLALTSVGRWYLLEFEKFTTTTSIFQSPPKPTKSLSLSRRRLHHDQSYYCGSSI